MKNWSVQQEIPNGYNALRRKIQLKGGQCAKCPSVRNITVDHIIPCQLLSILGFTEAYKDAENLQLLCSNCNKTKSNTLDYSNPKTVPLLKMYMERWLLKYEELEVKRNTRKITARCLCCVEPDVTNSNQNVTPSNTRPKADVIRPKEQVDMWNW